MQDHFAPARTGMKIKTDRIDARNLARLRFIMGSV
jgi:hypothetical protein